LPLPIEGSRLRPWLATLLGGLPSLAAFWWLISYGTFSLRSSGFSTNFYDEQAISFLHGKLSVPSSVASIEGFEVHGRTYLYFGPFLAVLRVPIMAIDTGLAGKLSVASMLVAYCLLLIGIALLYWTIRSMVRTTPLASWSEFLLLATTVFVASVGSVALFLGGYVSVYQETELWAVSLVVLGASSFLRVARQPSGRNAFVFGVVTLIAVTTRVSVGISLEVLAAVLTIVATMKLLRRSVVSLRQGCDGKDSFLGDAVGGRWVAAFAAITLVPLALLAAINEAKFGSLFKVPFGHQNIIAWGLATKHYVYVATLHPTFSSLTFLPTTLLAYFGPGGLSTSRLFPFVNFPEQIHVIGGAQFASLGPTTSVPSSMPAISALALIGILTLCLSSRLRRAFFSRGEALSLGLLMVGMAIGCMGVLTYATIANRYLGDLLPFFFVAGMVGLVVLATGLPSLGVALRSVLIASLSLLAAWSLWVNFGLGLLYQRTVPVSTSVSQRAAFASFRQHFFNQMSSGSSPEVTWGGSFPTNAPLGALYVQGSCQSLYQFGGSSWQGIEWSRRAGHVVVNASIPRVAPRRSLPLLVTGTQATGTNAFGLTVLPGGRFYEITYVSSGLGQRIFPGGVERSGPIPVPADRVASIDLVIDASARAPMRWYSAMVAGDSLLAGTFPINPSRAITVGSIPASLANSSVLYQTMLPRYVGELRKAPVTMPICSALRR
jgi:hypothetical protein